MRKMSRRDIPRLGVFMRKGGQAPRTPNHLTELLDEFGFTSYSERTLQPGRTPGRGLQGARQASGGVRGEGQPQTRFPEPHEGARLIGKAPEPQPGPFP